MSACARDVRGLISIHRLNVQADDIVETPKLNHSSTFFSRGSGLRSVIEGKDSCIKQIELSQNDSASDKCSKVISERQQCDSATHLSRELLKTVFHLPKLKGTQGYTKLDRDDKNVLPQSLQSISNDHQDFANLLIYLDSEIVSNWLSSCNTHIESLSRWISKSTNFCEFCHFWLSIINKEEKAKVLERENAIVVNELRCALSTGMADKELIKSNIHLLTKSAFHEYPEKLLGMNGNFLFLNYLQTLTSTKKIQYRKILSDVQCKVTNKQQIQGILAIRSFALINVWNGIINFFKKHQNINENGGRSSVENEPFECLDESQVSAKRILMAIRLSYVDVVDYLIKSGNVSLDYKDETRKNLFFHAAIMNRPDILVYLLKQLDESCKALVNERADSGNSALHASVNMDNSKCIELLLSCPFTDINAINKMCNGATPLHLAVMFGRYDVVRMLLNSGADPAPVMGDLSALQMAEKYHVDPRILKLLKSNRSKCAGQRGS